MIRFEDVERKVERHHPEADLDLLRRAYIYSAKAHKDQVRASGEPYLIHPLSVAAILADMKMDVATVSTGLLHDVVEDTLASTDDISKVFGEEVANLVDGVTKISNLGKKSKKEAQAENLRKMILAMTSDIRVVLVKLADRLHNLRTLGYLHPEKRKRIAQETLEVYAPIAHRLGMSKIRSELEDLSFQYLEPEEYKRLKEEVESRRASTEAFLEEVKARIAERLTEEGYHFEVQIRTEEMHRIAEEGIAAHWKYKEGRGKDTSEDDAMKWLRKMAEWQQDVSDARDFVDSFKLDLFPREVLAFTPKGKVIQLPRNATPIDFAYAIHTQVGDQCVGAKVNGKIVPLKYQIQNGDVVEIMSTPGHKPSRDWLNFVATSKARSKIKHWVAERQRAESVEVGRKIFEKEAVKLRLKAKQVLEDPQLAKFLNDNGYAKIDDMFAAIGYGKLMARTVLARFVKAEDLAEIEQAKTSKLQKVADAVKRALRMGDERILIKGVDDVLVYRAPCCSPIRGEEIIGYITRGKGMGVHATRCKNAANLMVNRERIVEVAWVTDKAENPYAVKLSVVTEDRTGQLAALTNTIANIKTNIRNASTDDEVLNDGTRRIDLTVDVNDLQHLERVVNALKDVEGVIEVERLNVAAFSA